MGYFFVAGPLGGPKIVPGDVFGHTDSIGSFLMNICLPSKKRKLGKVIVTNSTSLENEKFRLESSNHLKTKYHRTRFDFSATINAESCLVYTSRKIKDEIKVKEKKPQIISQQYAVYYFKRNLFDAGYVGYTCRGTQTESIGYWKSSGRGT